MFNRRLRDVFIVLFLLFSLTLIYGCSSKPSEDTIKSIIIALIESGAAPYESNLKIENFKITNSFYKKINDEKYYCIEANFTMSFDSFKTKRTAEISQARFSFIKRGKEWYGQKRWVE